MRAIVIGAWIFALLCVGVAPAEEMKPLQIGLLPINSTRNLVSIYDPLREYLEMSLGRPVILLSSADFRSFQESTIKGEFDLIMTAAHMGRLAELEAGYLPLARYISEQHALLVMAKDRPLPPQADLRGKVIAGIEPMTLTMGSAMRWLHKQGLQEGSNFTLLTTPTPLSAAYAVNSHQADLAVLSTQGMKQMPPALRNNLEVYQQMDVIPSLMWLANPRLKNQAIQLRMILLKFTSELIPGKRFYDATGYIGMREIKPGEMRAMDADAEAMKKLLMKQ